MLGKKNKIWGVDTPLRECRTNAKEIKNAFDLIDEHEHMEFTLFVP